jgi:transcription elongation GreA/GreB family factor
MRRVQSGVRAPPIALGRGVGKLCCREFSFRGQLDGVGGELRSANRALGNRTEFATVPPVRVDKKALLETLRSTVKRDLEVAARAAKATKEAATHEEAKPENDKDTRAIEASYLAGAQGERVRELERTLAVLDLLPTKDLPEDAPVGSGAVVRIRAAKAREELVCLFALAGGGLKAESNGVSVQVVTPKSPLGQALLGARVGDDIEVELGRVIKGYEVVEIG